MLNRVTLIGNLGRDPEMRQTTGGKPVCTFSIATSESWKDRHTGEKREATEWHRIVAFDRLAEVCNQYLQKGSQIYVEGKLTTRKWTDQSGQDRYTTEIVLSGPGAVMKMLGRRGEGRGGGGDYSDSPYASQGTARPTAADGADIDDQIPF